MFLVATIGVRGRNELSGVFCVFWSDVGHVDGRTVLWMESDYVRLPVQSNTLPRYVWRVLVNPGVTVVTFRNDPNARGLIEVGQQLSVRCYIFLSDVKGSRRGVTLTGDREKRILGSRQTQTRGLLVHLCKRRPPPWRNNG